MTDMWSNSSKVWIASTSELSLSTLRCSLRRARRIPKTSAPNSKCVNSALSLKVCPRVGLFSVKDPGRFRPCGKLNASANVTLLSMMRFLFSGIYVTFNLYSYTIRSLIWLTELILIFRWSGLLRLKSFVLPFSMFGAFLLQCISGLISFVRRKATWC